MALGTIAFNFVFSSVTIKKLANVYKSCPKNDFTRKINNFDTFTQIA